MRSKSFSTEMLLPAVTLAVLAVGALPATAGTPTDVAQPGPYAIGHTSLTVLDPSRQCDLGDRPIPVEVFYPVDAESITPATPEAVYPLDPINEVWPVTLSSDWEPYGNDPAYEGPAASAARPFPLVLFSPGWGAPIWAHNFLAGRVASHGFVVAVMYHYGDAFFAGEQFDHIATATLNRPLDVSFTLTRLLDMSSTEGDLLEGLIDPSRIAASGWSLGGYAAMALAAGVDNVGANTETELYPWEPPPPDDTYVPVPADPRIKAIVPLDGSNQMLQFYELARVTVPAMGMGQEWSTTAAWGDPWASWQARQHAAFQGHPAYRVDVTGAYHQSFSNYCEARELLFQNGIVDAATYGAMGWMCAAPLSNSVTRVLTSKFVIAFLKTHLVHEQGFQRMLTPGYVLKKEPLLEFFVTEKRSPQSIDDKWPDYFIYFAHQPGSAHASGEKNPRAAMPAAYMGLRP